MLNFDYFDVHEVQNNQFKQYPMILSDPCSKYYELSNEAKMAYMFMKDRFNLSLSNQWFDSVGHVYIYMTIGELCKLLNIGETKAKKTRRELVNANLLKSCAQGLNKPSRLYIGQLDLTLKTLSEPDGHKTTTQQKVDTSRRVGKRPSGWSKNDRPEGHNVTAIKTESSKTDIDKLKNNNDDDESQTCCSSKIDQPIIKNLELSEIAKGTDFTGCKNNGNTDGENQCTPENDVIVLAKRQINHIIGSNYDIGSAVRLVTDLIENEPVLASKVVAAIDAEYRHLCLLKEQGNDVLNLAAILDGDRAIPKLLTKCVGQQLNFMRDHLADHRLFSAYFAQGLKGRILTQVTTQQYFN